MLKTEPIVTLRINLKFLPLFYWLAGNLKPRSA